MELELIEPALYLRMAENAPKKFAQGIEAWLVGKQAKKEWKQSQEQR